MIKYSQEYQLPQIFVHQISDNVEIAVLFTESMFSTKEPYFLFSWPILRQSRDQDPSTLVPGFHSAPSCAPGKEVSIVFAHLLWREEVFALNYVKRIWYTNAKCFVIHVYNLSLLIRTLNFWVLAEGVCVWGGVWVMQEINIRKKYAGWKGRKARYALKAFGISK